MPKIYEKTCDLCGKEYRKSAARFCSRTCYYTDPARAERMGGNKFSIGGLMGRHWKLSDKTREKHKIRMGNGLFVGERHPAWKGGSWPYYRRIIKIRDNFTCQECGLYDPEVMHVDHIIPKSKDPSLAKDPDNLVTLCANCHMRKTNKEKKIPS